MLIKPKLEKLFNYIKERQSALFLFAFLVHPIFAIFRLIIRGFFLNQQLDLLSIFSLSLVILTMLFIFSKKFDSQLYNLLCWALNTKVAQWFIYISLTAEQLWRWNPIFSGTICFLVGVVYVNHLIPGDNIFCFVLVQAIAIIVSLYIRFRRKFLNQDAFLAAGLQIKAPEPITWSNIVLGVEQVLIQTAPVRSGLRMGIANRLPSANSVSFPFLTQKRLVSFRAALNSTGQFVKEAFLGNPSATTIAISSMAGAVATGVFTINNEIRTARRHEEQIALQRAALDCQNKQFEKEFALREKVFELEKQKFEQAQKLSSTETPIVQAKKLSSAETKMIPSALEQYCFDPSQLCSKYAESPFDLFF
jgi:hypothetical protein